MSEHLAVETARPPQSDDLTFRLMVQLENLQRLADEICTALPDDDDEEPVAPLEDVVSVGKKKFEELLYQLDRKQTECENLQKLNESLASEIASQKVRLKTLSDQVAPSLEEMTWEERKTLILQQLEQQDAYDPRGSSRLIDVVAETDRILEDRDREISELRELLRQQPKNSDEQQVIGATAIAEVLDSDQLICDERLQLSLLKQEWEEKLRQDEIEMSLRRAKLARDERELADHLEQARRQACSSASRISTSG